MIKNIKYWINMVFNGESFIISEIDKAEQKIKLLGISSEEIIYSIATINKLILFKSKNDLVNRFACNLAVISTRLEDYSDSFPLYDFDFLYAQSKLDDAFDAMPNDDLNINKGKARQVLVELEHHVNNYNKLYG